MRNMSDRKQDFIDDCVDAALESPEDMRTQDQIYTDALADWEARLIDQAYQLYRDEGGAP